MGWTGYPIDRALGETAETVRRREEDKFADEYSRGGCRVVRKSRRGSNTWWVLNDPKCAERGLATPFIAIQLWDGKGGRELVRKDVTESMGPAVVNCPLKFLDLAPETNEGWRERVRESHRLRNQRKKRIAHLKRHLEPGCRIELKAPATADGETELTVLSVKREVHAITDGGYRYRVPFRHIERITFPPQ